MFEGLARAGLRHLPPEIGFRLARTMASRVARVAVSPEQEEATQSAEPIRFGQRGRVTAWVWGSGPTVLLVHGWGGRGAQLAPLARHIARQGFRAIVFDVAGHGASGERDARWEYFIRDIGDVAAEVGNAHAWVGHSAGALTMMASRRLRAISAKYFVCICAPSHPHPPVRGVRQRLNPGEAVLQRYRQYLASQFQSDWASLEAGIAWAGAGPELLLCYDEKDRFIDHMEGNRIHDWCPRSTLTKTASFGHSRVLAAPELAQTITNFIAVPD